MTVDVPGCAVKVTVVDEWKVSSLGPPSSLVRSRVIA
ncbi:Uncharacterised protein [Mycobacteroides abscessus subsp. abscessus]|nr:Uncharacterised protein [Mycobacteroides abscessus subsp. abscessus]